MGNSLACICRPSVPEEHVILMKENGELLKFKKGVHVKDVTAVHRGCKIVKCGSDRSVLERFDVLQSNKLYFLIREDMVLCGEVHDLFWQLAEANGVIGVAEEMDEEKKGMMTRSDSRNGLLQNVQLRRSASWKPRLETIPEFRLSA